MVFGGSGAGGARSLAKKGKSMPNLRHEDLSQSLENLSGILSEEVGGRSLRSMIADTTPPVSQPLPPPQQHRTRHHHHHAPHPSLATATAAPPALRRRRGDTPPPSSFPSSSPPSPGRPTQGADAAELRASWQTPMLSAGSTAPQSVGKKEFSIVGAGGRRDVFSVSDSETPENIAGCIRAVLRVPEGEVVGLLDAKGRHVIVGARSIAHGGVYSLYLPGQTRQAASVSPRRSGSGESVASGSGASAGVGGQRRNGGGVGGGGGSQAAVALPYLYATMVAGFFLAALLAAASLGVGFYSDAGVLLVTGHAPSPDASLPACWRNDGGELLVRALSPYGIITDYPLDVGYNQVHDMYSMKIKVAGGDRVHIVHQERPR